MRVGGDATALLVSMDAPNCRNTQPISRSLLVTGTISKMHGEPAIAQLFATLEELAISVSKDDVLPIFASPMTKENAIAWIDEYLNPSTLLSKEELDL